ncbi:cytochrome c biogenesis CcdA family protein [Canibacter zhuwentaonis]|uniref:cytochrome c biogenesis CcdA family protein n=1 Tax=Canibacter zhuwentaonis TaxID=2837491 RepID=UPI002543DAE0|nr:cytochrome c biogenesis protein CcdA [Canibacter zhuwentaonis]
MQELIRDGAILPALFVAFLAGALSFFSPCVLPLVPGYLAYVGGSAGYFAVGGAAGGAVSGAIGNTVGAVGDRAADSAPGSVTGGITGNAPGRAADNVVAARRAKLRVFAGAVLFVLGFSVVFVGFFTVSAAFGAWLISYENVIMRVLGAVIILLGLAFVGLINPLQKTRKLNLQPATGIASAPVLGVAFALGWSPCIGPTLSVILALSLQEGGAGRGTLLGVCYCLGLGVPFVLVATGFAFMASTVRWVRKYLKQINFASGALLILIGLLMLTGLWTQLTYAMQAWISDFTPAL